MFASFMNEEKMNCVQRAPVFSSVMTFDLFETLNKSTNLSETSVYEDLDLCGLKNAKLVAKTFYYFTSSAELKRKKEKPANMILNERYINIVFCVRFVFRPQLSFCHLQPTPCPLPHRTPPCHLLLHPPCL